MRKSVIITLLALSETLIWGACGSGSSTITGAKIVGQTATQIHIQFSVPSATQAQVDVFSDSACTAEIPDTVTANAANRSGSVVDGVLSGGSAAGKFVQFVVGTRISNRALSQVTQYWIQIKNTGDNSFITLTGSTAVLPSGNTYPEQPLYDGTAWDNRGYPKFSSGPTHRNNKYVDPTTGLIVKPFTSPGDGWNQFGAVGDGVGNAPVLENVVQNSGSWTNPSNLISSFNVTTYPSVPSSNYATCTGNCDAWIALPTFAPPGGGNWDAFTNSAYGPTYGLDYIVPYVFASVGSGTPTLTASLSTTPFGSTYHGCQFTGTLSGSNTGYRGPADPDPGFAGLCTSNPVRGDIVPSAGTVNTAGTAVTRASGMFFQSSWPAGSYIKINGTFYQIASVNSPTSITLQTSAGTQSGVNYTSRILGIRVQASVGASTLSIQVGYSYGASPQWQVGEDGGQPHCNQNAVTVSNDAGGTPYSGYTLNGYVCWLSDGEVYNKGSYYLLIPKDQNGQPLGEVRVIGTTSAIRTFTSNGVTFTNAWMFYLGPDPSDGTSFYVFCHFNGTTCIGNGSFSSALLLKGTWNACSPMWETWAGQGIYNNHDNNPATDSACITYVNLTSSAQDVVSQIKAAYSTINLDGFALTSDLAATNGITTACMAPYDPGVQAFGDPQFKVCGTFNTSGTLTQVWDTFSVYPARWGQVHGPVHLGTDFHNVTLDPNFSTSSGVPLYGPFSLGALNRVNLAAYGATANWTLTTGIDNGSVNQYGCPSSAQMQSLGTSTAVANAMVTLGSTGNHCIEIEVLSEPCSATPSTGVIWSGGTKTEAQQFPCPTNAARSMLQTIQPGDWMMDPARGNFGESFGVLTKQITSPGGICTTGGGNCIIDLWLVRGNGLVPNSLSNPYNTLQSHLNGWSLEAAGPQQTGCVPIFSPSTGTHTWTVGFPAWCLTHGGLAPAPSSTTSAILQDITSFNGFDTLNQIPYSDVPNPPEWAPRGTCPNCLAPVFPAFQNGNGTAMVNGNIIQIYADLSNWATPGPALVERHLNPAQGSGGEVASGMGTTGYTLALVGGKTQTYTLTDPYSAGAPNQKITPIVGWAGRFMLQDYSGPGSVLPDSGNGGMCRALQVNECVTGSSAGTTYVSVPAATGSTQGLVNQHTQLAPAVINASPILGEIQQVPLTPDPYALQQRMLGQTLTGLGRQWQFNGPKIDPTASWFLQSTMYKDGLRGDVTLAQYLQPITDSMIRSQYVNVPLMLGGGSGDTVRVEFWYQEWGGVNGRSEHGYAGTGGNPFQWAYETPGSYTACSSTCTVTVPAIPGHVLYYAVHRKNGSVETTSPVSVLAVN